MKKKTDAMGRAIAEYYEKGRAERLRVLSPMFDEDEIPVGMLFRSYGEMTAMERKALEMARGKTLDVGAGAGCHSLVLQERLADVTAIDISPMAAETMRRRGVRNVMEQDFFDMKGQFDTILMLMNGIGIVGPSDGCPCFSGILTRCWRRTASCCATRRTSAMCLPTRTARPTTPTRGATTANCSTECNTATPAGNPSGGSTWMLTR